MDEGPFTTSEGIIDRLQTPAAEVWTDADHNSVQELYLALHTGALVMRVSNLPIDRSDGTQIALDSFSIAAYDNGQMRYVLRVKMSDNIYRVRWSDGPPSVHKKGPEDAYSKAPADDAEVVQLAVLATARHANEHPEVLVHHL